MLIGAEHGSTANLPIADSVLPDNLLAWEFGGVGLELELGWPLRLVVPHLYFWKSVKWVRSLTFLAADHPGFWGATDITCTVIRSKSNVIGVAEVPGRGPSGSSGVLQSIPGCRPTLDVLHLFPEHP